MATNETIKLKVLSNKKSLPLDTDSGSPYYVGTRAYVTQDEDGATITITDKEGTTTATVYNGEKGDTGATGQNGQDGQDGADGQDGFSPIANVTKVDDMTTITITDAYGTTTAYVYDGVGGVSDVEVDGVSVVDEDGIAEITMPTVPTKVSDLTNDAGYISSYTETDPVFSASAAAGITSSDISSWNSKSDFSGDYDDLTNKPTIPSNVSDLTNDSGFITSASVPTKTSDLTNDSGFITSADVPQEIYWATYGTTTNAEIEAAYQAGKIVCVKYNSSIYTLNYRANATTHTFGSELTETHYSLSCYNNVWSASTTHYPPLDANEKIGDYYLPDYHDFFLATYGTTTTAEIVQAMLSGKYIVVEYGGRIYALSKINSSASQEFSCVDGGTEYRVACINSAWSATTHPAPTVSVTRYTTTGTNIADLTINGTTTKLYAPTGGGGTLTDVTVDGASVVTGGVAEIDLTGKADVSDIPTKVSDLTNDSGYITGYTETDPTVPSWAKASSKPSYTFSEIGAKPTSISGYGITDAYTKSEIDGLVSGVLHYKGTKATTSTLPSSGNTTGDVWHVTADGSEWAWDGTQWQELGTAVDLSGYVPTSRTVNGKALTSDISLTASDVSALPSSTTIPTITDTYSGTSSNGMSGKAVKSAIDALDGTVSGTAGAGKTLTAFSQTDGKVSATFGNISITKSQVSDFPTIPTITDTYSGTSSDGMSGKAVKSAIDALDGSVTGSAGSGKTLTAFSQTNGVVSATFDNISITKSQISDFPTIPTVNNATLTIQKNGSTVNTFTANASSNVTANITVPTKVSDLTNDSGFLTLGTLPIYNGGVQ